MKAIRRWTSRVSSSVDWLVSQVENHDALVNSAIKEVQENGGRARVQIKRVQKDGTAMRKRLAELQDSKQLWEERAVKVAEADESRALECLKRRRVLEKEISSLETQAAEHSKIEKQLTSDLKTIDDRLNQLKQQRNILRSRQSRAEALKAVKSDDTILFSDIDEIFDRWESKVTEYEYQGYCLSENPDSVEEEFLSEEEESELKETLQGLLA